MVTGRWGALSRRNACYAGKDGHMTAVVRPFSELLAKRVVSLVVLSCCQSTIRHPARSRRATLLHRGSECLAHV